MQLFKRTPTPRHHRGYPLQDYAQWWSWSGEAATALRRCSRHLPRVRPRLTSVPSCFPYAQTYDVSLRGVSKELRVELSAIGEAITKVRLGSRMYLLRDLFCTEFTPVDFHRLLAFVRAALVELKGDPGYCLHSPLQPGPANFSEFKLHADLFLAKRLFLVFDDVSRDDSGASIFLPRQRLFLLLRQLKSMPHGVRVEIENMFRVPIERDSFDQLFSLLHSDSPWQAELAVLLKLNQREIYLHRGEGYLLHDRHWLHGRTMSQSKIGRRRFYRLVCG